MTRITFMIAMLAAFSIVSAQAEDITVGRLKISSPWVRANAERRAGRRWLHDHQQ